MHDIEYYDDSWDSSCFFVCIDRYYIFAADRKSKSPKWEFIDPSAFIEMAVLTKYLKKICQQTFRRHLIPFHPKRSTYHHCQKKRHF